jgi:hypothetical protein
VVEDDVFTETTSEDDGAKQRYLHAYKKNPCFIVMRYRPSSKKAARLRPGVDWNIAELSWVWHFLNDTDAYWNYLVDSKVEYRLLHCRCEEKHFCSPEVHIEPPNEEWPDWKDLPAPTLSKKLEFYTMKRLFALLKIRREQK